MILGNAGYKTTLIGLQHESSDPSSLGFDEVINLNAPRELANVVGELSVNWIREHARPSEPFFLTIGMHEPHRPFTPELYTPGDPSELDVPDYLPDTPEVREDLAAFHGLINAADRATGKILEALRETGLMERTIVVFTTDHGIPFPGAKSTLHDAGIGVALVVRVPDSPHAGTTSDRLVSHVDIVPTMLQLAEVDVPALVQGESFADFLTGGDSPDRESIFSEKNWHDPDQYDPVRSIRTPRFKLIKSWEERPALPLPGDIRSSISAPSVAAQADTLRPPVELYDLEADPDEQHNLAEDDAFATVRRSLEEDLHEFQVRTLDPLLVGPIPAPRLFGELPHSIRGRSNPHQDPTWRQ